MTERSLLHRLEGAHASAETRAVLLQSATIALRLAVEKAERLLAEAEPEIEGEPQVVEIAQAEVELRLPPLDATEVIEIGEAEVPETVGPSMTPNALRLRAKRAAARAAAEGAAAEARRRAKQAAYARERRRVKREARQAAKSDAEAAGGPNEPDAPHEAENGPGEDIQSHECDRPADATDRLRAKLDGLYPAPEVPPRTWGGRGPIEPTAGSPRDWGGG